MLGTLLFILIVLAIALAAHFLITRLNPHL